MPEDSVMKLEVFGHIINVYVASRIRHDEPYTLAWEITCPASSRPYKIYHYSTKDYYITDIQGALQDAVNALMSEYLNT